MGISWDAVPSLAFNMLDKTKVVYPKDREITEKNLEEWFQLVLKGKANEIYD